MGYLFPMFLATVSEKSVAAELSYMC